MADEAMMGEQGGGGTDPAARAAAMDQDIATARAADLGSAIPMAVEPLKAAVVNSLGKTIAKTIGVLSGGQLEERSYQPVSGEIDRMPQDIGNDLMTLALFVEQAGLDAYAFDAAEAMTTNDGLDEVQQIAAAMAADPEVLGAVQGEQAEGPEPMEGPGEEAIGAEG